MNMFLLILMIMAILVILCLIIRGIKDEIDIIQLEERLDEATKELKDEKCRVRLEAQKREKEKKYYEDLLKQIVEICDDKKYRGVIVLRGTIKKLIIG